MSSRNGYVNHHSARFDHIRSNLIELYADGQVLAGALPIWHLACSATAALGVARSLLLESFPATLETHLEREARAISAAGAGGERQEGIAAFLAKRKPNFA